MNILAPSVFAANYMNLQDQINILESSGVNWLHVDIMDGHFVPNMAFGTTFVKTLKANTKLKLDVHLMIDQPERMVKELFSNTLQMDLFDTVSDDEKLPEIIEPEVIEVKAHKKERRPKATYDEMFAALPVTQVEADTLTDEQKTCNLCGTLDY